MHAPFTTFPSLPYGSCCGNFYKYPVFIPTYAWLHCSYIYTNHPQHQIFMRNIINFVQNFANYKVNDDGNNNTKNNTYNSVK
jgi:hypothetical protein